VDLIVPGRCSGTARDRSSAPERLTGAGSCDEPTGDLDRKSAEDIMQLLQALNRTQGKTIVMVTHDPKSAGYASRELHLDKGRLVSGESREAA